MKIQVGTSGYGYKEWKGIFYPEKISAKAMLSFYAARLNTVEINYTFHHMPTAKILAAWREQVPAEFTFALKAPQAITHWKRLRNVEEEIDYLFKTLALLGDKQGPVLFQFPKSFRADLTLLREFLTLLPAKTPCAFEFRSPTWLSDQVLNLLHDKECSLCLADTDENPAPRIISTASWGYLRLRRTGYTEADLVQWLASIQSQAWQQAFVFFKHEEEASGALMAMQFRELAGSAASEPARSVKEG